MMLDRSGIPLEHYEDFGSHRNVDACYCNTQDCEKCGAKGQTTLYCPKCMKYFCVLNCVVIKDIKEGTTNVGTDKFCPVCNLKLQTWKTCHQPEMICDNCGDEMTRDESNIVQKVDKLVYICDSCLGIFNQAYDLIKGEFSVQYLKDEDKRRAVSVYLHKNLMGLWKLPIDYPIYHVVCGFGRKEKI